MSLVSASQNIPTQQSEPETWIVWYNSFPWTMSKADKNALFLAIWQRNGSDKANTDALRTFLKNEAGIELTTHGIGSVFEAGWSVAHGIESVFSVSAYALGGLLLLWLVFLGFGVYQAFKHPEATGKILGIAGKTAMKI